MFKLEDQNEATQMHGWAGQALFLEALMIFTKCEINEDAHQVKFTLRSPKLFYNFSL